MTRPRLLALLLACALLTPACESLISLEVRDIDLEPVEEFAQSLVYAADGSVIATLRFSNREPVTFADLPAVLVDAVVAAEDQRFWEHRGVDPRAIIRAWVANRQAGDVVQGGSTITQQLIKNRYFPEAANTFERKLTEARLAWELEEESSKEQILTDYLNTIYFGSGAYGIEAAAQTFFASTTSALTLEQATLLAGILRSPEGASPYQAPDAAMQERRRVLDAMVRVGSLDPAERDRVAEQTLQLAAPPEPPPTTYPFFVEYVKRQLTGDPHFGVDEAGRWRRLFGGGLRIHTTIDPSVQAAAEQASTAFWSGTDDPEVAIAVVDPERGHIVATVGGRDFGTSQFDLATQGRRQPGSTFKVFALAAALSHGWSLDDTIESGPGSFDIGDPEPWSVRSSTTGELTLREALVRSSNGAFARLGLELGPGTVAHTAQSMGVQHDVGTNPSIVLGGLREGVSPLEMASAFGTIANLGTYAAPTAVTHITDADGNVVWEPRGMPTTALDPETAWEVTSVMQEVIAEGTGQAASLGNRPAAGKTGTVQENRDAWFVGFTREYATAVWVGYPDDARPLLNVHGVPAVQGGTWPARIWARFYELALVGTTPKPLKFPTDLLQTVSIDPETGGLSTPYCPVTELVTALPGELPDFYCPVHTQPLPVRPSESPTPTASPTPTGSATPQQTPEAPDAPAISGDGRPTSEPTDGATSPPPPASPSPPATPTPTPAAEPTAEPGATPSPPPPAAPPNQSINSGG